MREQLTESSNAEAANIAGQLAKMRAEVRDYAEKPENADIRDQLLETMGIFERMIDLLAKKAIRG